MLASSQYRLSGSWDSTHHGFQTETGSGLGSLETGDNRHPPRARATSNSRVPGPCPASCLPLPLHPPGELEKSCRTWRVSFPSVKVLPGPWGLGESESRGAGDTPRGLTFWARTWGEGAVARMGMLQRPGVGFFFFFWLAFFPSLLLAAATASAAILQCGEGQRSQWTEIIEHVQPLVEDFCHLPYQ